MPKEKTTQGRKPKTKGEVDVSDDLKARREEAGLTNITVPIPYGQWSGKNGPTVAQQKYIRQYWRSLEEQAGWPKDLMSFEVWCGITLFKEDKPNGGDAFQGLMGLLLGYDTQSPRGEELTVKVQAVKTFYNAETHEYGSMFDQRYEFDQKAPDLYYECLIPGANNVAGYPDMNTGDFRSSHSPIQARPAAS